MTSASANSNGLSRTIPEDVKLAVRQACGFGCVLCGAPIVQYDHFNPEFKDAKRHDAAGIALLCGACHDRKTRRRISVDAVAKARLNPRARELGFVREPLELGRDDVVIFVGTSRFAGRTILRVQGTNLITVDPPESPGAPFRLNAIFNDRAGQPVCRIVDNELEIRVSPWDIEFVGPRLLVKSSPSDVALAFTTMPGEGFSIDRLDTTHNGSRVRVDEDGTLTLPDGTQFVDCQFGMGALAAICVGAF